MSETCKLFAGQVAEVTKLQQKDDSKQALQQQILKAAVTLAVLQSFDQQLACMEPG